MCGDHPGFRSRHDVSLSTEAAFRLIGLDGMPVNPRGSSLQ